MRIFCRSIALLKCFLKTIDFVSVGAFVHGLLDHPAVGRREIKNIGFGLAKFPGKDVMRRALNCAINLAHAKDWNHAAQKNCLYTGRRSRGFQCPERFHPLQDPQEQDIEGDSAKMEG